MRITDYSEPALTIREAAGREMGVPVSVGIAPTKTLSKLCNKPARKYGGVYNRERVDQDAILQNYPAGDVWGIGYAKTEFLKSKGINTAYDLKNYPPYKANKYLSIVGMRTIQELNGIPGPLMNYPLICRYSGTYPGIRKPCRSFLITMPRETPP
jgi:DNA polymerase V